MKDIIKLIHTFGIHTEDHVVLIDDSLKVVWVNDSLRNEGYPLKKVKGKSSSVFKEIKHLISKAEIKKCLNKNKTIRNKKFERTILPIEIKDKKYAVVIYRPDKFREELQYISAFNSMDNPVHMIDREYNIVLFNEAFKKFNKEHNLETDVFGKNLFDVFPFLNNGVKKEYEQVFRNGKARVSKHTFEYKGEKLPVETERIPIFENDEIVRVVTIARDITDRVEAEDKFKKVAEQSPNMIFINQAGKLVYVNPKCEEVMGYSREEMLSPKFDFKKLVTKEDRKLIKKNFKKHMQGKELEPYEYKIVTKDGRKLNAIHSTKLIDYKGKKAILGIVTDVTELREAQEQLKNIVDNSPDSIILLDLQGKITGCNQKAVENTGYEKKDIIGLHFSKLPFLSKEQIPKLEKIFSDAKKGKEIEPFEVKSYGEDGEIIIDEVLVSPLEEDGEVTGFQINSRDITERGNAKQEIIAEKEFSEKLIDTAPGFIVGMDTKGKINLFNQSAERISGYKKEDVIGKSWFKTFIKKGDREKIKEVFEAVMKEKKQYLHYENSILTKDGEKKIISWENTTLRDDDDKVTDIISIGQDITERKKVQQALQRSNVFLRNIITEITGEVSFEEALEMAIESICDFIEWDYGESWSKENDKIEFDTYCMKNERKTKKFLELTKKTKFSIGEGLIGRVWKSKKPEWIIDSSKSKKFVRRKGSKESGIKTIFAIPVISDDRVTRVLAFAAYETKDVDDKLINFVLSLGNFLGTLFARKKTEEKLRQFKIGIEKSGEAIFITNPKGEIEYVNSAFEKIYGYSEEEVLGENAGMLKGHLPNLDWKTFWKKLSNKKVVENEVHNTTKTGKKLIIENTANPIVDEAGNITGYLAIQRDITKKKEYERKIQKNEEELVNIFDNLPIGIAVNKISTGKATHLNDRFAEIYGWPKEELTSVKAFLDKVYGAPEMKKMKKQILEDVQSGDLSRMKWDSIKIKTKKGEEKIINAVNIPLPEQDLMISTVQDVTEKEKNEEEREKLTDELQQRVAELERFQNLTVGRELRMIELKDEIAQLKNNLKEEKK